MTFVGMDQNTGKILSGLEHLRQSIRIILSTPIGSRVMLPEFGSEVFYLVDARMTTANELRLYSATIDAIERWEPRIEVESVRLSSKSALGVISLDIVGIVDERLIKLEGITISGSA